MISKLIHLLVVALVLVIVFWVVGMFIAGKVLPVIGAILALIFLGYAVKLFGIDSP